MPRARWATSGLAIVAATERRARIAQRATAATRTSCSSRRASGDGADHADTTRSGGEVLGSEPAALARPGSGTSRPSLHFLVPQEYLGAEDCGQGSAGWCLPRSRAPSARCVSAPFRSTQPWPSLCDVVTGCATSACASRSEAVANRPNGLWTAGSREGRVVVAWLRGGASHFELVGAGQALARQTAPTSLAHLYHLTSREW